MEYRANKYKLGSRIGYIDNFTGNSHVLMLVVDGIAGISFEHPIIQKPVLSSGWCYQEENIDIKGHLYLECFHCMLFVNSCINQNFP